MIDLERQGCPLKSTIWRYLLLQLHFSNRPEYIHIDFLLQKLRDGVGLLQLYEALSGAKVGRYNTVSLVKFVVMLNCYLQLISFLLVCKTLPQNPVVEAQFLENQQRLIKILKADGFA